jgi:glycosyltransferase involved in cell wall biosynthesis
MRILQVNKFWFARGGVEAYLAGVVGELRRRGHEVAEFGMTHEANQPSAYAASFAPFVELGTGGQGLPLSSKVRTALRILYAPPVAAGVRELCAAFQPELAHVHLFERQLTYALIRGLRACGVPIVQTFHDYSYVCANYTLMKGMTTPCPMECTRQGYWRAVRHRCVKHSRSASALAALELFLRRDVFRYQRSIAAFVSPSAYLRRVLVEGGLDARRVLHVPNFVRCADYEPHTEPGEYVLFVGRLSFEKGLWTLLDVAAALPRLAFRIVGEGPEEAELRRAVAERGLGNVRLDGQRTQAELRVIYRDALCVVMPSEWPENAPMVIYEAFAAGKPVVGTALGGIPELVADGIDGRVVSPADAAALTRALADLAAAPRQVADMGAAARAKAEREYDLPHHVDRLSEVYEAAVRGRVPNASRKAVLPAHAGVQA